MKMENVEELKKYFGSRLTTYEKFKALPDVISKLSKTNKIILFDVGLPIHWADVGEYVPFSELNVVQNRYLKVYTRVYGESYYSECIDLDSNKVVYFMEFEGKYEDPRYMNKDLEAYLYYVKTIEEFRENVLEPEKLGPYWRSESNCVLYAEELAKNLQEVDKMLYPNELKQYGLEVSDGWLPLIREMEAGTID